MEDEREVPLHPAGRPDMPPNAVECAQMTDFRDTVPDGERSQKEGGFRNGGFSDCEARVSSLFDQQGPDAVLRQDGSQDGPRDPTPQNGDVKSLSFGHAISRRL
jgi:hypothetical protein